MPITVPDQTIAAQVQVPDTMKSLGSIMNLANQRNQYQQGQQAIQSNDLKLQGDTQANSDRQAAAQFMSTPANWQNEDGTINLTKANNILKIAPQTGSDVVQKLSTLANAQTTASKAKMDMGTAGRSVIGGLYGILGRSGVDDPAVVASELDQLKTQYGPDSPISAYAEAAKVGLQGLPAGAGTVKKNLITQAQALMSPEGQNSAFSPKAGLTDTGGALQETVETPSVAGGPASVALVPGSPTIKKTLPPTQGTVSDTGEVRTVGAPASDANPVPGNGLDMSRVSPAQLKMLTDFDALKNGIQHFQTVTPTPQGVRTSLPVGVAGNIENNVASMGKHYEGLQDQSSGAQLIQGLTGNIKALAKGAATGTAGGGKAYVSGLIDAFMPSFISAHLPHDFTGDLKADTDLLEKNMAQLNLGTPGSGRSDAAQTLVGAARPHSGMQESAIMEAADQVASQVKANMAIRNYLTPYKYANNGQGDSSGYQAARQTIESVADPRAWQYESMPAGSPQRKAFMAKLTPEDRTALIQKTTVLENMGMFK